jgi:protein-disulfide isomerase
MQDGGQRFRAFHEALFKPGLRASEPRALEEAGKVGYDVAKLEADLDSEEVSATLTEVASLAKALRAPGTPVLVIGKEVIRGQTHYDTMKTVIARARGANAAAAPSG